MTGSSDWDLLKRTTGTDAMAFTELVERHYRAAVAFCLQIVGDRQKAEDIVQQGFVNIYRTRERLEERARFRTLLFRILTNLSLNELQKKSSIATSSLSDEEEGERSLAFEDRASQDPAEIAEFRETQDMLRKALARLRPEHRAALYLRESEGLGYGEIALALKATLGEVKIWIHRARRRVAALLSNYVEHGEDLP